MSSNFHLDNRIHDSAAMGVTFDGPSAKATLRSSKVWGNAKANVRFQNGADPLVADCKIHGGCAAGVNIGGKGTLGEVRGCDIHSNAEQGVVIHTGANPRVEACRCAGVCGLSSFRIL